MKKVLLTGFEPFGGEAINPSWEAIKRLPDMIDDIMITKHQLPVEYDRVGELLATAIAEEQPDAVICVGQAGQRAKMSVEMVAVNIKDASVPDNAGISYSGEPVIEGGPAAYFATIPVKKIAAGMQEAGVPCSVSYTAGTYVCNSIMYHLLHILNQQDGQITGGFIHVPYTCEQVLGKGGLMPSLPLEYMTRGLAAAICASAETSTEKNDKKVATGAIC